MGIRFNSLRTRLTIALLLLVILPVIAVGWTVHNQMSEYIRSDRISDVGRVADAKHEQLVMVLARENSRAKLFLSSLSEQCGSNIAKPNHICATRLIDAYLAAEGAIGANIHKNGGSDSLTIGMSAVQGTESIAFQPAQLAKFSSTGPQSKHSYFVSAVDESTGLRLSITYPSSVLEPVFNPPPADLGFSGETFLADGEGYFVTSPRYHSTQGNAIPISAHPMRTCLSGQAHEALDLDYRDAKIIHGFRFIPEFGSACIMAHVTQDEAFAPLKPLKQQLIIALLLFSAIPAIAAVYLAKSIVKPIIGLTEVTRSITAGVGHARADTTGSDELAELASSFNRMTDQLQTAQQHEAEALGELRVMLNTSGEGFWKVDQSGRIIEVNDAYCHIVGYTRDGIVGEHVSKFEAMEQTPEAVAAHIQRVIELGYDRFETKHRHHDGHLIDIEVVASFIAETKCFIAFLRNVVERKQAEILTQQFGRLLQNSFNEIYLFDASTLHFIQTSEGAKRNLGYSIDELKQLTPIDIKPLFTRESFEQMLAPLREGKLQSLNFETVHRRKDGTTYPVEVNLQLMASVTPVFLAIIQDITERKEAIEKLRDSNIKQESINHQLQEAQSHLLQSEKMASIGQLAAGVAHEINNPIGYVYSNLGTLEKYVQDTFGMLDLYEQAEGAITDAGVRTRLKAAKDKLDFAFLKQDLRALMDESKDGITRVKKIVQNLKDFSHVDAADEWHFSDLHSGIDSTLNIVNNEIKYKANVVKEYGELPEVECLSSQLNQVFMNLLVNAAHAIEERGTITIRTGQQGEGVFVQIADTGKGIAPEHIKKIFDPFFTTKPVGKGTGLGLSLSYSIMQKHNGRIEVQSEVGKGTTFTLWLPVKHVASAQSNKA